MAGLLSVNVGPLRDIAWKGRTVHSGVWKNPVHGRSRAGRCRAEMLIFLGLRLFLRRRRDEPQRASGISAGAAGSHQIFLIDAFLSLHFLRQFQLPA